MITAQLIEEWIAEVEARPGSAPVILRALGERLRELSRQNEALLTENHDLRRGQKAQEYESRIANLEYQLELLKRQLGGALDLASLAASPAETPAAETVSLLLYTAHGQVLRLERDLTRLESGAPLAAFAAAPPASADPVRLQAARSQEELLLVFDSGRSQTRAALEFPAAGGELDWTGAVDVECRGLEALAAILQIGTLPLYQAAIQVSRRGYLKKFSTAFFETCIAKAYVGSGVRLPADQTCALVLANPDQRLVLVSREGFIWNMAVADLPITLEEAIRLGRSDHLIAAFSLQPEDELLLVTGQGKLIHRTASWLAPDLALKGRGQAAYSQSRREAGVRLVGAGALRGPQAWGFTLQRTGQVTAYRLAERIPAGCLPPDGQEPDGLLGFAVYSPRLAPRGGA